MLATTTTTGTRPTEWVKRLLAAEGAFDNDGADTAIAAGRVYDKLADQLAPLLGPWSVWALFARSAKLAQAQSADLGEAAHFETGLSLCTRLQAVEPAVAGTAAESLFATFLALIPTFIGERLTRDALRRAWPHVRER